MVGIKLATDMIQRASENMSLRGIEKQKRSPGCPSLSRNQTNCHTVTPFLSPRAVT